MGSRAGLDGRKSLYIYIHTHTHTHTRMKDAFVGVTNEQFNSIKMHGVNEAENLSKNFIFTNSSPTVGNQSIRFCLTIFFSRQKKNAPFHELWRQTFVAHSDCLNNLVRQSQARVTWQLTASQSILTSSPRWGSWPELVNNETRYF